MKQEANGGAQHVWLRESFMGWQMARVLATDDTATKVKIHVHP